MSDKEHDGCNLACSDETRQWLADQLSQAC